MAGNFFHTAHPHTLTDIRLTLLTQIVIFWEKIQTHKPSFRLVSVPVGNQPDGFPRPIGFIGAVHHLGTSDEPLVKLVGARHCEARTDCNRQTDHG